MACAAPNLGRVGVTREHDRYPPGGLAARRRAFPLPGAGCTQLQPALEVLAQPA